MSLFNLQDRCGVSILTGMTRLHLLSLLTIFVQTPVDIPDLPGMRGQVSRLVARMHRASHMEWWNHTYSGRNHSSNSSCAWLCDSRLCKHSCGLDGSREPRTSVLFCTASFTLPVYTLHLQCTDSKHCKKIRNLIFQWQKHLPGRQKLQCAFQKKKQ